ncbi:uncharacterized protein [Triticum aestivum]|uniref:uncharacterized protein isoform X1 n=1 Tax=Triticum aestivum TaxID=4565 RepID=UPI001D0355ED|nr:uncharacterized protein LOC123162162 isoform X1 [Triticum aestivum]
MAAATPSKSNKDVMAFDYAKMLIPISPSAIRATLDYDISAICKILMANDGRSVAERMDYLSKNFASFKKPEALVPVDDLEDEDDEEFSHFYCSFPCPLCKKVQESVPHLLFQCRYTVRVWGMIKSWLGLMADVHSSAWMAIHSVKAWWNLVDSNMSQS